MGSDSLAISESYADRGRRGARANRAAPRGIYGGDACTEQPPAHGPALPRARGRLHRRRVGSRGRDGLVQALRGLQALARHPSRPHFCDYVAMGFTDFVPLGGDRAYGDYAEKVTRLARAAAEGMIAGGVTPVIKHIPGHGRADVDSHKSLPRVDTALDELKKTDFIPFRKLNDFPCAMTAHVIYSAIDSEKCATVSRKIIGDIIRGEIAFRGVLFSDDLSMKALNKAPEQNALDALEAGCDLALHCNGNLEARHAVLKATIDKKLEAENRLDYFFKKKRISSEIDHDQLYDWLSGVMKGYE